MNFVSVYEYIICLNLDAAVFYKYNFPFISDFTEAMAKSVEKMWKVKELKIINEIFEKYKDEKLKNFISTTVMYSIEKEKNKWLPVKYASIICEL